MHEDAVGDERPNFTGDRRFNEWVESLAVGARA